MKECPNCHRVYDDSWRVCLDCETSLRLIAEDSIAHIFERLIAEFDAKFPLIFTPFDGFYDDWNGSEQRLRKMLQDILQALRIENATVSVGYKDFLTAPGLYECNNNMGSIFIDRKFHTLHFKVAAILAHEFMHHYFQVNRLNHPNTQRNELLVDLSTIAAGLGIIVINGMSYSFDFSQQKMIEKQESFGYYKPHVYCEYFEKYLKFKKISGSSVIGYIHPRAREFLSHRVAGQKASSSLKLIDLLEHQYRKDIVIKIIKRICTLIAIILVIPLALWIVSRLIGGK